MGVELLFRAAKPGDRPAMERICAETFDWGDYVPGVWDDWLADEQGLVLVGEVAGTVVALSKVTFQTPDQVWLEGMRVDPAHRQKGIAGRFLDYSLTYARQRGARVARLGTSQHNLPVQRMVAHAGMERAGSYVFWLADPLEGGAMPSLLTLEHAPQVGPFFDVSEVLAHTQRLYSFDWAWQELSWDRIVCFLEEGRMAGQFADDGTLVALAPVRFDADDGRLWIGMVDGQPWAVTVLGLALRAHAAQLGAQKVQVMLPDLGWLRDALAAAGFGFGDWEGNLWIYERQLADSPRPPRGGSV